MAAPDQLSIVNLALGELGQKPLTQAQYDSRVADNNTNALVMANNYDIVRRAILGQFPYKFCSPKVALTVDEAESVFGYSYAFPLPADCLTVFSVINPVTKKPDQKIPFEVDEINGFIGCDFDDTTISILYAMDLQDTTKFDDNFTQGFGCMLAAKSCKAITGKTSDKQGLINEAGIWFYKAGYRSEIQQHTDRSQTHHRTFLDLD